MKPLFCILFLTSALASFSQVRWVNFISAKSSPAPIDAFSPKELALSLTADSYTDLEKVRAIFYWITDNIEYNVITNNGTLRSASKRKKPAIEEEDTSAILKPLNERVAEGVLKRRVAVCDGYSRLFKTLCDYAGVKSVIIHGYARTGSFRLSSFRTNHSWNAVYLDSAWHLLDATWASGYTNYSGTEFIRKYDSQYFLTPPELFIRDHYPEDLQWTLLSNPPSQHEFFSTPFKYGGFIRHQISSFSPAKGVIEAKVGDTIVINLETKAEEINQVSLSTQPFYELAFSLYTGWKYAPQNKGSQTGQKITCSYIIRSPKEEWLYVLYRGEVIMRYKLNIKRT